MQASKQARSQTKWLKFEPKGLGKVRSAAFGVRQGKFSMESCTLVPKGVLFSWNVPVASKNMCSKQGSHPEAVCEQGFNANVIAARLKLGITPKSLDLWKLLKKSPDRSNQVEIVQCRRCARRLLDGCSTFLGLGRCVLDVCSTFARRLLDVSGAWRWPVVRVFGRVSRSCRRGPLRTMK